MVNWRYELILLIFWVFLYDLKMFFDFMIDCRVVNYCKVVFEVCFGVNCEVLFVFRMGGIVRSMYEL